MACFVFGVGLVGAALCGVGGVGRHLDMCTAMYVEW